MSFLPQLDSCRFLTIEQIRQRISDDNFTYKSVRVLAKIKQLHDSSTGYCLIESLNTGAAHGGAGGTGSGAPSP